jgi:ABC-type branched-subunit amino acid transport system ATPase component
MRRYWMRTWDGDGGGRPEPTLAVSGLTAGYGGDPVVNDVSMTVGSNEIVSIVGPNGAGKSTLLGAVMGRVDKTAGSVHLHERDVSHLSANDLARAGLGFVPQTRDVFETLTVRENLEMGGYLLPRKSVQPAVDRVLTAFPALAAMQRRRAGQLSGGERKMLAISRVLMLRPKVLILDEPTANLAPQLARTVLREEVPNLAHSGMAVLIVEQRALEALETSDWGYVMVSGRLQIAGRAEDLLARPDLREVFLGQEPVVDSG